MLKQYIPTKFCFPLRGQLTMTEKFPGILSEPVLGCIKTFFYYYSRFRIKHF